MNFDTERLAQIASRFARARVAVLGDFFLDKYLETDPALAETSLETAKTAHQVVSSRHAPGAAGNVVSNLAALGAAGIATLGFTGDDGEGWELRRDLAALGCDLSHLQTAPNRVTPTYLKPRDIAAPGLEGEHSRYDSKNRLPLPPRVERALLASLEAIVPRVDAVVVTDQVTEEGAGVMTPPLIDAIARLARLHPRVVFWVDSRVRIRHYRRAMIKINQFELTQQGPRAFGECVPEDIIRAEAAALAARAEATVFATLGERGVHISGAGAPATIPGIAIEGPIDTTGAGDSFSAGAVLALASGALPPEAALTGNLASSVTVRQLATTGTARPADLAAALEIWQSQQAARQR